jgi:copper transport protein
VRSLVAGFAPWFAGATVVLAVSGVLLAGAQLPAVAALLSTGYGAMLAVKVALLALVVVLAAQCHRRLAAGRRPQPGVAGGWRALGATLGVGVAGATVAALLAAVMAAAPPVRDGRFLPPAAAPARMTTVAADGLDISFSLSPNRPGRNLVTVDVLSVEHPALAPVRGVTLRLLRPGDSTPRQIAAAPTLHPNVFDGGAVELRDPGDLEVSVVVSRAGVPALRADLTWTVDAGRPSAQSPAVSGQQLAPATTTAALLIVAGTGLVLHLLGRRRGAEKRAASRPGGRVAAGTVTPRDSR